MIFLNVYTDVDVVRFYIRDRDSFISLLIGIGITAIFSGGLKRKLSFLLSFFCFIFFCFFLAVLHRCYFVFLFQ